MQAFLLPGKHILKLNKPDKKIRIAVSSCLSGHNVRYDGASKNDPAVSQLCDRFDCVAICPEAGSGLGIPRPPLKILKTQNRYEIIGETNPRFNVTESIEGFAKITADEQSDICGYIFKSRSPSCGVYSTPWYHEDNEEGGVTSGIFANRISELFPGLPIIEETQLDSAEAQLKFIEQVRSYSGR